MDACANSMLFRTFFGIIVEVYVVSNVTSATSNGVNFISSVRPSIEANVFRV